MLVSKRPCQLLSAVYRCVSKMTIHPTASLPGLNALPVRISATRAGVIESPHFTKWQTKHCNLLVDCNYFLAFCLQPDCFLALTNRVEQLLNNFAQYLVKKKKNCNLFVFKITTTKTNTYSPFHCGHKNNLTCLGRTAVILHISHHMRRGFYYFLMYLFMDLTFQTTLCMAAELQSKLIYLHNP